MKSLASRKGAVELSVGTIVVLVIGMTMLVLGIILVRTIFSGATSSVERIDEGVKDEINKLFSEGDKKVVVKLPNNEAEIKKGESTGVAFAVRNTVEGENREGVFSYQIKVADIERGCDLPVAEAESYLIVGDTGSDIRMRPGDEPEYFIVKIRPSEQAPLCEIVYRIEVRKDNQAYDSEQFIASIVAA